MQQWRTKLKVRIQVHEADYTGLEFRKYGQVKRLAEASGLIYMLMTKEERQDLQYYEYSLVCVQFLSTLEN